MSLILFGSRQPQYNGYKYFGQSGYIILLKMTDGRPCPIDLPEELTMQQISLAAMLFDIVEEYSR